ncbi:MAG: hypothetical protein JW791_00615 [Nanoarchaeota archaeon]|nr:hypothetical protein [Nanoarchaeota archaeon]
MITDGRLAKKLKSIMQTYTTQNNAAVSQLYSDISDEMDDSFQKPAGTNKIKKEWLEKLPSSVYTILNNDFKDNKLYKKVFKPVWKDLKNKLKEYDDLTLDNVCDELVLHYGSANAALKARIESITEHVMNLKKQDVYKRRWNLNNKGLKARKVSFEEYKSKLLETALKYYMHSGFYENFKDLLDDAEERLENAGFTIVASSDPIKPTI